MKISGVMPSFETSMTPDEMKTLVEYVRSMSEGK
jgi:hypothetical protein